MEGFASVNDALDFAIEREQEAYEMYTDLASKMDQPGTKAVFTQFAGEELGHKAKLESVKKGRKLDSVEKKIMDLKIGDYLVDVEPREGMSYQDALILAMKREQAAYQMYKDFASRAPDDEMKGLFLGLAQEEAKHKLRFEVEYDEKILTDM
jgi:rubrerythrin